MKRSLFGLGTAALLATATIGASTSVFAAPHRAMMNETVMLKPMNGSMVSGKAVLTYNSRAKMSSVKVTVMHLKAGTIHPEHFHLGRCGNNGAVVVGLPNLVANKSGTASAAFTFKGNFAHKQWYLNIHNGPGISPASQFKVLACGNVM